MTDCSFKILSSVFENCVALGGTGGAIYINRSAIAGTRFVVCYTYVVLSFSHWFFRMIGRSTFLSNSASNNNGSDIRDYYGTRSMWTLSNLYETCSSSVAVKLSVGLLSEKVDENLMVFISYFFPVILH
jgi:hypothetical protein